MSMSAPIASDIYLSDSPLNLVIVGQGAIGLLWYRHFQRNSQITNVQLLNSLTKTPTIQNFTFTNVNGNKEQVDIKACSLPALQNAEIVLICVKCYQIEQVIKAISPFISDNTLIILCHNGMGVLNENALELVKNNPLLTLLTTHGSMKISIKDIVHTGQGQSQLGLLSGSFPIDKQTQLIRAFNTAMPEVRWCKNISEKQWIKLAINCVINPLTALYDINNGQILLPKFETSINELIQEIVAVAQCKALILNFESLKSAVLTVAKLTENNCSSMRSDIHAKRRTEIDHINGYIHALGLEHGISTPKNTELYHKVLRLTELHISK